MKCQGRNRGGLYFFNEPAVVGWLSGVKELPAGEAPADRLTSSNQSLSLHMSKKSKIIAFRAKSRIKSRPKEKESTVSSIAMKWRKVLEDSSPWPPKDLR